MTELLPLLNIIVVPIMVYVVKIERRLTRIETILKINNPKRRRKNVGENTA